MQTLDMAMRWLHIMAAMTAAGASVFALVVLVPAMRQWPEDVRSRVHDSLRPRFAKLMFSAIGALLLSGLYNYILVKTPLHKGQGLYHGLMGVKILLALAVFFVASALVGQAPAFEVLRRKRPMWLAINVMLVAVIVAIGAVLSRVPYVTQ